MILDFPLWSERKYKDFRLDNRIRTHVLWNFEQKNLNNLSKCYQGSANWKISLGHIFLEILLGQGEDFFAQALGHIWAEKSGPAFADPWVLHLKCTININGFNVKNVVCPHYSRDIFLLEEIYYFLQHEPKNRCIFLLFKFLL